MDASARTSQLPRWGSVLAVVAHPDDESFGLGSVISSFIAAGMPVDVLCFTHGEASSLHGVEGDLAAIRERELGDAARALGIREVRLLAYPDGGLSGVDVSELAAHVTAMAREQGSAGLLAFDTTGVTGHPDHVRATQAALAAAAGLGIDVLAWTLPHAVAADLARQFSAGFTGVPADQVDITLRVDRTPQRLAVTCHPSQAVPGSALWRRLDLLGDLEHLRWLAHVHRPGTAGESDA